MLQPSLKNTFDEIMVHFKNDPSFENFNGTLNN